MNISEAVLLLLQQRAMTPKKMAEAMRSAPRFRRLGRFRRNNLNERQVYAAMSTLRSKRDPKRNLIQPIDGGPPHHSKMYELTRAGWEHVGRDLPKSPIRQVIERVASDKPETVNHPPHYGGDTTYEVVKVMEAWLTPEEFIGAMKFNSFKYGARHRQKGGLEDLKKKKWYDDRLADYLDRHPEIKV